MCEITKYAYWLFHRYIDFFSFFVRILQYKSFCGTTYNELGIDRYNSWKMFAALRFLADPAKLSGVGGGYKDYKKCLSIFSTGTERKKFTLLMCVLSSSE